MDEKRKKEIWNLAITLGAIVIIIGAGLVYYFDHRPVGSNNVAGTTASSTTPTSTAPGGVLGAATVSNAGWRTYADVAYGYAVEYPATWSADTTYANEGFYGNGATVSGGVLTLENYSPAALSSYQSNIGRFGFPADYQAVTVAVYDAPGRSLQSFLPVGLSPANVQVTTLDGEPALTWSVPASLSGNYPGTATVVSVGSKIYYLYYVSPSGVLSPTGATIVQSFTTQ